MGRQVPIQFKLTLIQKQERKEKDELRKSIYMYKEKKANTRKGNRWKKQKPGPTER